MRILRRTTPSIAQQGGSRFGVAFGGELTGPATDLPHDWFVDRNYIADSNTMQHIYVMIRLISDDMPWGDTQESSLPASVIQRAKPGTSKTTCP